ncbi:hypothetical protein AGLY_006944 [Aphis glycines]|uniref:Uncharacterized protein n=1 Tax=Aphis glycines TaxID=307491 RepID=A0A6G0TRY9_APHGL|nr:hypothetical protein AGLY_006944 [Aphis glycines]
MKCDFFFVFVFIYSITCRNNALILNFGAGFRLQSEYFWCIIEIITKWKPNKSRSRGRFRQRWENRVKEDLRILGVRNGEELAAHREIKFVSLSTNAVIFTSNPAGPFSHRIVYLCDLLLLHTLFHHDSKITRIQSSEVQILTKIHKNYEYVQIILLTNYLCSESFLVYYDTVTL